MCKNYIPKIIDLIKKYVNKIKIDTRGAYLGWNILFGSEVDSKDLMLTTEDYFKKKRTSSRVKESQ